WMGRYDAAILFLEGMDFSAARLLRAEALQRRGDYDRARADLEAILADGEGVEVSEARVLLGRLLLRRGDYRGALEACRQVAETAEKVAATEAAPIDRDTSAEGGAAGASEEGAEGAAEALSLDAEVAGAVEVCGLAHFYMGAIDRAAGLFAFAEARLKVGRQSRLQARFRSMLGMVAFARGDWASAAAQYQGALEGAEATADAHAVASYRGNLGSARLELGEYREALKHLSQASQDLARLARNAELASVLHNLGGLMLFLGDIDRVEVLRYQAAAIARSLKSRHVEGFVEILTGDLARRRGDRAAALEAYARAERSFHEIDAARERLWARLATAETLLDLGRVVRCAQVIEAIDVREDAEEARELCLVRARLRAQDPSSDGEALRSITEELAGHCATLEVRGAKSKLWRSATVLGRLLAATGRRGAAIGTLRRARALWEELMSDAPEIYRGSMAEDPDARSLAEQWQALVDVGKSAAEGSSPGESRPGWQPDEHRLRRLLAVNKRLNSELRLPNLLEMIVDTVIELTDAERGFLILVEGPAEAGGEATLSIKLARNIDRESLDGAELDLSRSIAERAAKSGQPIV
ncbi:MAG: tetratricopeptide repeat protein, partial [Deltaproteobacteria bacterium]|nr:tetratricopeptide repeat protein [Deltaproteobacteria bacterium]